MKEYKKIFSEAEVTENKVITGSDKDGEPIYSDEPTNQWTVDVSEKLGMTIGIEAESEDEARTKAFEWYTSQEQFGFTKKEG